VLILTWENDDIKVQPLARQLGNVFEDLYNYQVVSFVIPVAGNPNKQLHEAILTFIRKHDGPHNLLICYYSGHATANAGNFFF
jgi:hypothetical protein